MDRFENSQGFLNELCLAEKSRFTLARVFFEFQISPGLSDQRRSLEFEKKQNG